MNQSDTATVTTTIEASAAKVWDALINPDMIKRYMFGTQTKSDWTPGSPIRWTGEWQGRAYEDKGTVLEVQPGRRLRFTHFSPLSGLPDTPDNYQTVTMTLAEERPRTTLVVSWNKNPTEEARRHNEQNWMMVLDGLKKLLEQC